MTSRKSSHLEKVTASDRCENPMASAPGWGPYTAVGSFQKALLMVKNKWSQQGHQMSDVISLKGLLLRKLHRLICFLGVMSFFRAPYRSSQQITDMWEVPESHMYIPYSYHVLTLAHMGIGQHLRQTKIRVGNGY